MSISKNIQQIKNNISLFNNITILAATKTVPKERFNELKSCGITTVGENRVQEFLTKYESNDDFEWHFIGSLQTNKVKNLIGKVRLIHSLDRESLADEIEYQSFKKGITTSVLLELNMGGEASKSGIAPEKLSGLYNYVRQKQHIKIEGFMAVMPIDAKPELYYELQQIFNAYKEKDKNIITLSVGMSNDYLTAIKYGATLIRLGSAIFGQRVY